MTASTPPRESDAYLLGWMASYVQQVQPMLHLDGWRITLQLGWAEDPDERTALAGLREATIPIAPALLDAPPAEQQAALIRALLHLVLLDVADELEASLARLAAGPYLAARERYRSALDRAVATLTSIISPHLPPIGGSTWQSS